MHHSRGQSTSSHAHYAWKVHVGLDAPVWLYADGCAIEQDAGARVVVVPPGVAHRTGAIGWSLAVFLAPGSRGTPWHASGGAFAMTGALSKKLVATCLALNISQPGDTEDFATELGCVLARQLGRSPTIDPRVENALWRVKRCPPSGLEPLARSVGLSLDRLSRLVVQETGFGLQQHVLWNRMIGFLSSASHHETLAAAAAAHGFADHAHLTRTCRRFIGRAPSEFKMPPEVLGTW